MKKSLFLYLYATQAFAWGQVGHQTIGEIAERNLSPKAQSAVTSILGAERLGLAATWADDVRDDPDFDVFKPYHFISIDGNTPYDNLPESDHSPKDAMTVLKKYPALLQDPKTPRSVKIAALKYLIHVVGDVHQPMHIGKKSDSGGNACLINWDKQTLSLHQVWDGRIIDYDMKRLRLEHPDLRDYNFIQYADDLVKRPMTKPLTLHFSDWVLESQLIRDSLYPGACTKVPSELPLINDDYKKKNAEITEDHLLTAGLRLAALLNDIFKDGDNPGTNESLTKKQIIDKLNLSNY